MVCPLPGRGLRAAYYYLQITPKVYTASAAILVKSDEKNSGSEDMLLDLGIKAQKVNITNEIMSMLTGSVADEITRRLQLNTEYYHPGTFHKAVAYGVELPVTVELPDLRTGRKRKLQPPAAQRQHHKDLFYGAQ